MAHHKHWADRGAAAFRELAGPSGGDTGNANAKGYETARGGKQVAGVAKVKPNLGTSGPAKQNAKPINELIGKPLKSQSGGAGTKNYTPVQKLTGAFKNNPRGDTSNYKSGSVQKLTGRLSRGGKHNGREG